MNSSIPNQAFPLRQRGLRVIALAVLSVASALILILGLIGVIPLVREKAFSLLDYGSHDGGATIMTAVGLGLALVTAAVFLAAWRWQSRSWRRIAFGYAGLGAVLAYLAHDEPTFRHPVTMEEISPAFPGADVSYQVLMKYGKQHPLGQNFKGPSFKEPYPRLDPTHPGTVAQRDYLRIGPRSRRIGRNS